jgi:hypothetical protein
MRRDALAAAIGALIIARPAAADVDTLLAVDSYLSSTRTQATTTAAADLAWSAHLAWRAPDQGAVLDWVARESLIGGAPRRELHELNYVERRLPGLELTLGRFRVPGGFWLITDGAGVAVRTDAVVAGVYGGSRSFTNGRAETLLVSAPHPLPLAGASITTRGSVAATVAYTYTADRVSLYRGDGVTSTTRTPEQFLDAELAAPIGARAFVTAGASVGSRYLVTYPTAAARVTDDPNLDSVWFGAQSAYALVDLKLGAWRLDAIATALRTKLGQVDDPALAALTGSFVEGTGRARWHPDPGLRLDGRYRLRLWADHSRAQRAELSAAWQRGALAVAARVGLDAHHNATAVPGLTSSRTLLYRASAGYKTARTEATLGVAAVAALGDELAAGPADDPGDQRAPYTLEARSYAFAHLFATRGAWFAGVDGEVNLRGDGVRALLQIGCSP